MLVTTDPTRGSTGRQADIILIDGILIDGHPEGKFPHMDKIEFVPIGFVENEFRGIQDNPDIFQDTTSKVRVLDEYAEGLYRLDKYERLNIIYVFDRAHGYRLVIHPRGDTTRPERGVFATRAPYRPNPIGLAVVDLISIEGNVVTVRNLDAIDGTPVLDIKPWEECY
jgi:tRNA-Thr(GGU) m(6)t(6)A37 methyltransferase TsaA